MSLESSTMGGHEYEYNTRVCKDCVGRANNGEMEFSFTKQGVIYIYMRK